MSAEMVTTGILNQRKSNLNLDSFFWVSLRALQATVVF